MTGNNMDLNTTQDSFSCRLKRRMKAIGAKQVDVAAATGASPPTVSAWYRGKTMPRSEYINKLSSFLETTPEWLLEAVGDEHIDIDNPSHIKEANPVAARIRSRMLELELGGVDLVNTTSATKGAVSKWVRGGAIPSQPFLAKLAVVLETTPNWILYGEDAHADNEILSADEREYLEALRKKISDKKIGSDKIVITLDVRRNTYRVEGMIVED